jgi:hypothetical protein
LIDPWVYRSDGDPRVAVRAGARLRSSPDLDDLPELAPLAIARRAQLDPDPATPRHADGWVRELGPQQVERYAELFDAVVDAVRDASHTDPHDHPTPCPFACEVLSTLPYPVARVLERHRLGRFRVTQKAKLDDPSDVYRSESARPEDWILIGNHDTPPLQALLPRWRRDGELETRAHQLARLLRRHGSEREREDLAAELTRDPGLLAQACFAELFSSPARNVFVYFTDLFGFDEPYNRPGDISAANWSLRIPGDFRRLHRERARAGAALDLPRALALALGSRPATERSAELVARLDAASARWA